MLLRSTRAKSGTQIGGTQEAMPPENQGTRAGQVPDYWKNDLIGQTAVLNSPQRFLVVCSVWQVQKQPPAEPEVPGPLPVSHYSPLDCPLRVLFE